MAVARSPETLPYAEELARLGATLAYTRYDTEEREAGSPTRDELAPLSDGLDLAYVCGSARFAEYAETLLVDCGLSPQSIRVERFGPTG